MASFDYAVRYWVTGTCVTPLRSGCAEGGVESLLHHEDNGQIFLQAPSLAGALRGWLEANGETELAQKLFGSRDQAGQLIVSDGEFSPECTQQSRPRLRINGWTGSADAGSKFDVVHMECGSTFVFSLLWTALQKDEAALAAVEQMLAALHNGEILLGAQKSNGFGRVSLAVVKQKYNLRNPTDRTAWMEDKKAGAPLALIQTRKRRNVVFTLTGYTNSILVKSAAGRSSKKGSFATNIMENGVAILPGSSIKGAVRTRADAIVRLLHLDESVIDGFFGRGSQNKDNGKAGLIRFEDVILPEKKQAISRIRINRFTGGALRTGLFGEEPHSGSVTLKIIAPDEQPAACALLLFALRDLGLGLYNLGSGWSVGRGYIAVREIVIQTPSGVSAALRFDQAQNCTVDDPQNIIKGWVEALEAMKCEA